MSLLLALTGGVTPVAGTLAVTLEGITPAISGKVSITGTASISLSGITPSIIGAIGSGTSQPATGGGGSWSGSRHYTPSHLSHQPSYYYRKIIESDAPKAIKREAAAIVRPFTEKKSSRIPKVRDIDWKELALATEILNALIKLWVEEIKAAEIEADDDEWMILL